jgi:hypothetical protein
MILGFEERERSDTVSADVDIILGNYPLDTSIDRELDFEALKPFYWSPQANHRENVGRYSL